MKIGIFCDAFFPENKAVAVRLFHLSEAFANQPGITVTVHTSTKVKADHVLRFYVRQNFLKAPSNEGSNLLRLLNEFFLGLEMLVKILFSRYDLLLISSPPFFAGFLGILAAKIRGIPFVFDVRDEYPEVFFTAGLVAPHSLPGKILMWMEKFIYKNAYQIITVTEGICQRIDNKIKSPGAAVLVRNGFDGDLFKPSTVKESTFTVVFHGNIGKFQNPALIISLARRAWESRLDIRFKVIGWGNNDESLKQNPLPNLEYLGMVNYHDISNIIARAHIGISFRSNETISQNSFPVKLYEYIGVGLPVIVTPISEAGYFFEKNGIGFQFNPHQEDLIFDKLIELSQNKEVLKAMTERISSMRVMFSRQQISNTYTNQLITSFQQ